MKRQTDSGDNQRSNISKSDGSKIAKRPKSKTNMWYNQPFNHDWLKDSDLKDWIESDPNDRYIVHCKVCDIQLTNANKSALVAHKSSQKHRKNVEINKQSTQITSFFVSPNEPSLKDQVAKAELLLSAFMAEHHIPFQQADHLTDALKNMFPDSKIAKSLTMKRTKVSYVIQDGMAPEERDDITKICQSNKFSAHINSEDMSLYENEDKSTSTDHDYSRMLTSTYNPNYHHILPALSLQTLVRAWLQEDAPAFDFAGFVVGEGQEVALLLMKEAGVIAGRPFVDAVFKELGCSVKWCVQEGDYVEPVKTVAMITGKMQQLLLGERVALNCITRCSGIATTARRLSKIASASGWKGSVAGTRKTTPGFRLVEKYALLVGGVSTHDLSSMIMLKDNHIWTAGSVTKAVKDARQVGGFSIKIEVECRSLDEAIEAADTGADIIMLDNFSPKSAQEAASRLKTHFPSLVIELSGGITESNLTEFCLENIDVVSLDMLTQGYSTIDFSFKIRKEGHDPKNPTVKTV